MPDLEYYSFRTLSNCTVNLARSNAIWEWFFHNTNAHVLIARKIYFKRRFMEARVRISGGERERERERWMRKRKSEIRRQKERETGYGGKSIKLQLYWLMGCRYAYKPVHSCRCWYDFSIATDAWFAEPGASGMSFVINSVKIPKLKP